MHPARMPSIVLPPILVIDFTILKALIDVLLAAADSHQLGRAPDHVRETGWPIGTLPFDIECHFYLPRSASLPLCPSASPCRASIQFSPLRSAPSSCQAACDGRSTNHMPRLLVVGSCLYL